MILDISPVKVTRILGIILVGLVVLNIGLLIATPIFGLDNIYGLLLLLDFDRESNLPTLFSSLMLLTSASLLYLVGRASQKPGQRDHLYWLGLSLIFAYIAVDEVVRLHERLVLPLRGLLNTSGVFHFAWVIPYGIGVVILGLIYLRFIRRLPKRTMWLLVLAGTIYVSGALGMELIGGYVFDTNGGTKDLLFGTLTLIEETLELTGVLVLIYTLMTYLESELGGLSLRLHEVTPTEELPARTRVVDGGEIAARHPG